MSIRRTVGVLLLLLLPLASAPGQDDAERPEPERSSLVERAASRLVQLDVTLSGPERALQDISAADFTVKVGMRRIEDFRVDKLCREPTAGSEIVITSAEQEPQRVEAPRLGPATFLIYFDQPHLTLRGRAEGLAHVRELIPRLIVGGNRGMIVSNGERVDTFAELTDDPQVLLEALDRLDNDPDHWDPFSEQEGAKLADVMEAYADSYNAALTRARMYYQEELWRAERNLRRFSMVLGRLSEVDAPKAVIYLADTMRQNAGQHFLDLFGEVARNEVAETVDSNLALSDATFGALLPFDGVVNEASSHGLRLYTIEAQGMQSPSSTVPSGNRTRHAQGTLKGLALETGGEAFINGVRPKQIAEKIIADFSCLYLISFEPEGLALDTPLPVKVQVDRKKVRAQVRGRIVVQSESARLTSRLMAAYTGPETAAAQIVVHPSVIPTGYENGQFSALVQVAVPGSGLPGSSWDLGASVVSRGKVQQSSGRLTLGTAGVAAVLQQPMKFAPGPFEMVAIAHNLTTDVVSSQQLEGEWPRPNAELAAIGPIAVLQPAHAAIWSEAAVKTSGAVAFAQTEPVMVDRPTAVVVLVCKSRDLRGALRVERSLAGAAAVDFDPAELDLGQDACAVLSDVIPAKTMTPGSFHYRIRVADRRGEELAADERKFYAWDGRSSSAGAPAESGS